MDYNGESTILYDCLEQDEYILWEGKPGKGNLFSAGVEMGREIPQNSFCTRIETGRIRAY